jgi:F-box/TPR repeat protein Pof3
VSSDPFSVLPNELAEMIILKLNFRDLVFVIPSSGNPNADDCRTCLCVSKQWCQYLSSLPSLWKHLDFSNSKRQPRMNALKAYVQRSKGGVTRATFNRITTSEGDMLSYLTKKCQDLHYLRIRSGFTSQSICDAAPLAKNLCTLILSKECGITLAAVSQVFETCKSLSQAEFHNIISRGPLAQWPKHMNRIRILRLGTSSKDHRHGYGPLNLVSHFVISSNVTNILRKSYYLG